MDRSPKIADVIAADNWRYSTPDGKTSISHIEIGRPRPAPDDPNGDWYCSVFVEGFTEQVVPVYGVGSVDALMNAMALVRGFADKIREFTPRASDFPQQQPRLGDA